MCSLYLTLWEVVIKLQALEKWLHKQNPAYDQHRETLKTESFFVHCFSLFGESFAQQGVRSGRDLRYQLWEVMPRLAMTRAVLSTS